MAKVEINVDVVHETSLENSADSEYMGMVEEGSLGAEEGSELESQAVMSAGDNEYFSFKEMSNSVTYKLIPMPGEDNMETHTSSQEFYVISNPVEVYPASVPQKKSRSRNPIQAKAATAKKRDDKRRATHNEVERRRRDKINSWITKLAALVPDSGPDTASKGGILAKACDHINELTKQAKKIKKAEAENEKLVVEILRLNKELGEVRSQNTTFRSQLELAGIVPNFLPNLRAKRTKF